MSTLEELKKQALEATNRNRIVGDQRTSTEQAWRKLGPVMKYLKDHFTELANSLNVLNKDTFTDFEINKTVKLKRLRSRNYKITYPSADRDKDFVFEFENQAEHPVYCLTHVGSAATAFKQLLTENQIKCVTMPVEGNKQVKFEIQSLVKSKYRFKIDLEKEVIGVTISNYNNIWTQTNYLRKEEITTSLMDELTKHVMREPSKYNELVGNTISEEMRTKLREKLHADLEKKKADAARRQALEAAEQESAKKEKTIIGKFFTKKK